MELSVVVPAYREIDGLRSMIERSLAALRPRCDRFEIILVDDCGGDGTGELADQLAQEHPEIRVIHNERNMGAGASVLRGFRSARYDLITHNAVDYPFDFVDLDLFFPLL